MKITITEHTTKTEIEADARELRESQTLAQNFASFLSRCFQSRELFEDEETEENWNKTPWLAYARDPFIVDLNMKIKKVSWMSKDGEPVYNF